MKKEKKLKLKLSAAILVAVLVGVVALGFGVAKASNGSLWDKIAQVAGQVLGDRLAGQVDVPQEEPTLGAVSSQEQMGAFTCQNDDCSYYLQASFSSSTIIASIPDPFLTATSSHTPNTPLLYGTTAWGQVGATSTVELVRVTITGAATTTINTLECAASASQFSTTTPRIVYTEAAIASGQIGVIQSGMSSTTNPGMGSLVVDATANNGDGVTRIMLTPQKPYLNCSVKGADDKAFTDVGKSWAGVVNIRVSRQRY